MKTIFELATPCDEVLQGDLREDMFAARLKDVMLRTADDVYKDPNRFFENTFPTDGLKTLLDEVVGRVTGQAPANNPIIRLETSFGGAFRNNERDCGSHLYLKERLVEMNVLEMEYQGMI